MAIPAVGSYTRINVALVAELFLAGVALHTGVLKADGVFIRL